MIIHVLPGDAQREEFSKTGLEGEVAVCREAFIDGSVRANSLGDLWKLREEFWAAGDPHDAQEYRSRVVSEFEKLDNLSVGDEVNLWFEFELFCQVNMWFCVWLLSSGSPTIYRVAPHGLRSDQLWTGFGKLDAADLRRCFDRRTKFDRSDTTLGKQLWEAYRDHDHARLTELSSTDSKAFPYLKAACDAEIEKDVIPRQILRGIKAQGIEDFGETFAAFSERAGVYGYGDAQVRRILENC